MAPNHGGPLLEDRIPLDRFGLIAITGPRDRDKPSRTPLYSEAVVPDNVTVEYYEEVAGIIKLEKTPYMDAGSGIGLTCDFPGRLFSRDKRMLVAICSAGIHPSIGTDRDVDTPTYVINQIQGLVKKDRQPRYSAALHEGGFFWRNTLVRAQETVARNLGITQTAIHCGYPPNGERSKRVLGAYGRVAKEEGYKKAESATLMGRLWVKTIT